MLNGATPGELAKRDRIRALINAGHIAEAKRLASQWITRNIRRKRVRIMLCHTIKGLYQ